MIEIVKESLGIALLSFVIVYGLWYLGLAMDAIYGYAFGMRDWEWE